MPADVVPGPEDGQEFDFDAEFSAIVSGISGEMQWGATSEQLDAAASYQVTDGHGQVTDGHRETPRTAAADPWGPDPAAPGGPVVPRAPSGGTPGIGMPPGSGFSDPGLSGSDFSGSGFSGSGSLGSGFSGSGSDFGLSGFDTADDRRRRRELRRLEREAELEAFQEEQAAIQAARDADTEHFEPPPPPPLPRPRGRTVGAVLVILAGIAVLAWPRLLALSGDATLILGLLLILGGLVLLFFGLRRRRGEPGEGWDDGAVV